MPGKKIQLNIKNVFKGAAITGCVGVTALVFTGAYKLGTNMNVRDNLREEVSALYKDVSEPRFTDAQGVTYHMLDGHVMRAEYADQTLTYNFNTQTVTAISKIEDSFSRQEDFADWGTPGLIEDARQAGCRIATTMAEQYDDDAFDAYARLEYDYEPLGDDVSGTDILEYEVRQPQTFAANYCPQ